MSRMMRSMMSDPFFLDPFAAVNQAMVGFGTSFPSFDQQIQSALSNPNAYSYCSSSVTSYSLDPTTGRPQVYQAHSSAHNYGGVRETRESVRDSRTGVEKMAIGHHIDERGHVIARERNAYSGQQEQTEEFINIEETEAPSFNQEWRRRAAAGLYNGHNSHHQQPAIQELSDSEYQNYQERQPRALPAPPPSSTSTSTSATSGSTHRHHHRRATHNARAHNPEPTPIVTLPDDDDDDIEARDTNVDNNNSSPTSPASHGTRRGCESPSSANRRKKYKEKKLKSKPYAKK